MTSIRKPYMTSFFVSLLVLVAQGIITSDHVVAQQIAAKAPVIPSTPSPPPRDASPKSE